jgi:hypothetical protein
MPRKQAAIIVAVLTVLSAAATGYALYAYEDARARWTTLSESLGDPGYDAAASDAAYAQTETWLPWIGWLSSGTSALLLALALAIGSLAPKTARTSLPDAKLLAATVVDLLALLVAALPAWLVVHADPGLTLVITRVFPAVAGAWIAAAAASGRTLGARALRLSLGTSPGADVGLRLLFAQPILLVVPFLLVMSAARRARGERPPPRWLAPHLALAGVSLPDA